jgi:hypothetical protein
MSLLCDETGRDIEFGTVLMAGIHEDNPDIIYALSQEALRRIPESEKRSTPCESGDGGINVHEASSSRNFNGSYSFFDFTHGGFVFSVSKETAEKHLPTHSRNHTLASR